MTFRESSTFFVPEKALTVVDDDSRRKKLLERKRAKIDKRRPKLDQFVDQFGSEKVNKAKQKVAQKRQSFAIDTAPPEFQNVREFAEIFEGALIESIEQNNWFGTGFRIALASEYDDYVNGIDGVGVFSDSGEDRYIGFGVDVSLSGHTGVIDDKFSNIERTITGGNMPELEFFMDEHGQCQSMFVPKIVFATQMKFANSLVESWESGVVLPPEKSYLRSKLVWEALAQLKYFHDIAKKFGNTGAMRSYRAMYGEFRKIYVADEKTFLGHYSEAMKSDEVFAHIMIKTGMAQGSQTN